MSQAGKYILTIIILVFFSALFSAVETAYSSASKIRLRNMENDGNMNAGAVLRILDDFDRFLTTVLIGNNIVNIAGATVGTLLFTLYFAGNGPTISTIVITIVTIMKCCALEASSIGIEQGRVDAIDFDVAMFTNLTHEIEH